MRRVPLSYPELTPINAMTPGSGVICTIKTLAQLEDLAAVYRRLLGVLDGYMMEEARVTTASCAIKTSGPLFGKHQLVSLAAVLYHTLKPDEEKKVLAAYPVHLAKHAKVFGVSPGLSAKAPLNTRPGVTSAHTNVHAFYCDIRFDPTAFEWASDIPDHAHWHPGPRAKYEDPKLVTLKEAMASFLAWRDAIKEVCNLDFGTMNIYKDKSTKDFLYSSIARVSKSLADSLRHNPFYQGLEEDCKQLAPWIDPRQAGEYLHIREVAQAFTRVMFDEALPMDAWTDVLCADLVLRCRISLMAKREPLRKK